MERFTHIFWMFQGFNLMYNADVFTTTLWARFICNQGIKDGIFEKVNKNYYKHIK